MKKNRFVFSFLLLSSVLILTLSSLSANEIKCTWTGVEKIIAVGDIHGDYDNFITILKNTGILSDDGHWKAGLTHFVQTGDIMDRGPDAKKALDLVMKLETEAEQAGGRVHFLIGNHEEMNITGISFDQPGYVTPEQFVSFLPDDYKKRKERKFKKNSSSLPDEDKSLRSYWSQIMRDDERARQIYIEHFNKEYGEWILKHNVVIMINDIVFVHGGISKKFSDWELSDINDRARYELRELQNARLRNTPLAIDLKIVFQSDGPFWYRELARQDEKYFKTEVDDILDNLKAKAMVIAHTPKTGITASAENMSRFDKRVWIIDTGISESYGGILSALIIENGDFFVWSENNEKYKK
jgi:hypothetical protein